MGGRFLPFKSVPMRNSATERNEQLSERRRKTGLLGQPRTINLVTRISSLLSTGVLRRDWLVISRSSFDQGVGAPCNRAAEQSPCNFLYGVNKPAMSIRCQLLCGFQSKSDEDDKHQ